VAIVDGGTADTAGRQRSGHDNAGEEVNVTLNRAQPRTSSPHFHRANALVLHSLSAYVIRVDIGRTTGPLRFVTDGRTFQPSFQIR
jgi:hypothetical protein